MADQALLLGVAPLRAIELGFVPRINEVGRAFRCQEMFLPDRVRAGEAMKAAMAALQGAVGRAGAGGRAADGSPRVSRRPTGAGS
ncbi:MAG: B12-binding domain-containing protein [Acidobacteria bacterium]|nr:B12-binding domain-containing protein [Acidobacteriota bacterium]